MKPQVVVSMKTTASAGVTAGVRLATHGHDGPGSRTCHVHFDRARFQLVKSKENVRITSAAPCGNPHTFKLSDRTASRQFAEVQ